MVPRLTDRGVHFAGLRPVLKLSLIQVRPGVRQQKLGGRDGAANVRGRASHALDIGLEGGKKAELG